MSTRLMGEILYTKFGDLKYVIDGEKKTAKGSTVKLLLLALADCGNEEGDSIYPGLTTLQLKTELSRRGLLNTIEALKQTGILTVSETPSRIGTNEYKICVEYILERTQKRTVVKPVHRYKKFTSEATTPASEATSPEALLSLKDTFPNGKGQEPTPKPKSKSKYSNVPGIAIVRGICHHGCDDIQAELVIKEIVDMDKWKAALIHWMGHGWNPRNVTGMIDSYKNGGEAACLMCNRGKVANFANEAAWNIPELIV